MLIKQKEKTMKLQFKKVQKSANELGLGLARYHYTGQDANGEKMKYAYRMFVANNEEQSRFDSDSRHGFDNFSGRDNFLGGDLKLMSLENYGTDKQKNKYFFI